jgi:hypothetical protein
MSRYCSNALFEYKLARLYSWVLFRLHDAHCNQASLRLQEVTIRAGSYVELA